jgi:hypothetical protein
MKETAPLKKPQKFLKWATDEFYNLARSINHVVKYYSTVSD